MHKIIKELVLVGLLSVSALYAYKEHGRASFLEGKMAVYVSYAQDNMNTEVYHK